MHVTSDGPIACAQPQLHSQCGRAGHGGPQLEGGGGQSPLAQRAAAAIAEEEHLNWSVWLHISSTVIARCLLLLRAYICPKVQPAHTQHSTQSMACLKAMTSALTCCNIWLCKGQETIALNGQILQGCALLFCCRKRLMNKACKLFSIAGWREWWHGWKHWRQPDWHLAQRCGLRGLRLVRACRMQHAPSSTSIAFWAVRQPWPGRKARSWSLTSTLMPLHGAVHIQAALVLVLEASVPLLGT